MKRQNIVLFTCLLGAVSWSPGAASNLEISGVTLPLYAPGCVEPSVLVQIDRVHKDHKQQGFFRIGALPILAADTVLVRVADTNHAVALLAKLDARLQQTGAAKAIEWRRVSFFFGGETTARLQARRMRAAPGEILELFDGQVSTSTNEVRFARARLHLSGEQKGRLTARAFPDAPPVHIWLFSPLNTQQSP